MLSLPVQKDIGEYQEKVVAGLSAATLACLAIGIAFGALVVGLCKFIIHIPDDYTYLLAAACVTLGFAIGFVRPINMPTWEAAPFLYRSYLSSDTAIHYASSVHLAEKQLLQNISKELKKSSEDKENVRIQKKYLDERDERGVKSPEWLFPRYAGWQPGKLPPS
jgi:hypothetical protein